MSVLRPTTFGLALAQAVMNGPRIEKAGEHNWISRRVAINIEREGMGVVKEQEQVRLSHRTAAKLKAAGYIA
jgi:hypothetical protein